MLKLSLGAGGLIAAPDLPGLPPPRVGVMSDIHQGLTRSGVSINVQGTLLVKAAIPAAYFSPKAVATGVKVQLELLRYRGTKHTSIDGVAFIEPAGFYHPSSWVGGVHPAAVAGTRGGGGGGAVDRPTEWPVTENTVLTIPGGSILAPWFEIIGVRVGITNKQTIGVYIGKKRQQKPGGGPPKTGVFAFRFASLVNGEWITGPESAPIYVRPRVWPSIMTRAIGKKVYTYNSNMNTDLVVSLHAKMG